MKPLKNSNVLITGGAGFIGSNLARSLVNGNAKVTILDLMLSPYGGNLYNITEIHRKIKFICGDIRSASVVKKALKDQDYVFHLAGQTGRVISIKNPYMDASINCTGTLTILEAIKSLKRKPKLIFTSSRGVYGKPTKLPVNESLSVSPSDIYGINKLTAENYCFFYGREYGFGVTVLRLNNVYGPRCQVKSNHYGTINLFISSALQGKKLLLYGDGTQTRDYIFVEDVVDALKLSMDNKADGELFMVGSGKSYSLNNIAMIISNEIPLTRYQTVPYPSDLEHIDFHDFRSDPKKIYKLLGWEAKIGLREGIKKTIEYYKKNLIYYI